MAIKAESFVDAKTKTGLDKPALVVSASFDEGKFERVRFGQVGDDAYGMRDGEAGIAKIEHQVDARRDAGVRQGGHAAGGDAELQSAAKEVNSASALSQAESRALVPPRRRARAKTQRRVALAGASPRQLPLEQLARSRGIFTTAPSTMRIWAVAVRSLQADETLYSLNRPDADAGLESEAAHHGGRRRAARLGLSLHDAHLRDRTVTSDGDLDGDLVIVSNGDPTINPRHPDRWGAFDAWAQAALREGHSAVGGHLIGDDNAFEEPGWGSAGRGTTSPRLRRRRRRAAIQREPGRAADRPGLEAGGAPSSACRLRAAASSSITASRRPRRGSRAAFRSSASRARAC